MSKPLVIKCHSQGRETGCLPCPGHTKEHECSLSWCQPQRGGLQLSPVERISGYGGLVSCWCLTGNVIVTARSTGSHWGTGKSEVTGTESEKAYLYELPEAAVTSDSELRGLRQHSLLSYSSGSPKSTISFTGLKSRSRAAFHLGTAGNDGLSV